MKRSLSQFARLSVEALEDRTTPAVVTPFTPRFSTNDTGDISLTGNTLMTASTVGNPGRTQAQVTAAQAGTGNLVNDNDWFMSYVDVDSNGSTFNSSQANLNLPAGSTILFAGLYWGSTTTTQAQAASRNQVLFGTPGTPGYTPITGTIVGSTNFTGIPPGSIYEGFADVTSLVRSAGNGTYTVANVQGTLQVGAYSGWSMVVAYRAPGLPARSLTVFDGYAVQASSDPSLDIPISGFIAPPSGPVNARVGIVAYEGDRGTTGDSLALNGVQLSDAYRPANNFFNSTITNSGALITAKSPNYVNQMGIGITNVKVPAGVISNGASNATIRLSTSGDGYFPGAVTFAIDLFSPDMRVTKSFNDLNGGQVLPGDEIEYQIAVSNSAGDPAGNVILRDAIPAGTTYIPGSLQVVSGPNTGAKTDAANDDQAEFDGNDVVFRLGVGANEMNGGAISIGSSTNIRFRVRVDTDSLDGAVILNQGSVNFTGITTGFDLSSDSNQVSFPVSAKADLAVTKSVNNASPNVGDAITFRIGVANNGPISATGVSLSDLLPAGLTFVNATTSQGTYDPATGIWDIGGLTVNGTAELQIQVTVTTPGTKFNTASIATLDQTDPNRNNNQSSVTVIPLQADLQLIKTVNQARPNVGANVTFTLTVSNNGPTAATNVKADDLLPAGLTFVNAVPTIGTYDAVTGVWTIGNLANQGTAQLTLVARVDTVVPVTNIGTVTATQFDPDTSNNSSNVIVSPQRADLQVVKTVSNPIPNIGETITYTIQLANLGQDTATGIVVQDTMPAGVTVIGATPSRGSFNVRTGVWTVASLPVGETAKLTIRALVTNSPPAANIATITKADQFDPNTTNNTSTAVINPIFADLRVTKTVNNPTPTIGEVIAYTVTLTNLGPESANGVIVSDAVPAVLTFMSATPSQGTYDSTTGKWTFGTLPPNTSATLLLSARVDGPNSVINTAVASSNTFDPNPNNNRADVVVTPAQADISVVKSVSNRSPNVGDTVTFSILASNFGPDLATGVRIADLLPNNLTFVSATPTSGTFDSSSGIWSLGTLAVRGVAGLRILAIVNGPDASTNLVTVTSADQPDPNPKNNTATVTITPQQANLAVVKTVNNPTPNVGQDVTFTVTVTNQGPNAATNATVTDLIPNGLTFVSANPARGTYDPGTGTWLIGNLSVGASVRLTIRATVNSVIPATNTATVKADQFDPDMQNNTAQTAITPQRADLAITKTVDNPTPSIGNIVTYTITLTNVGPDTATGIVVNDILPSGVNYVSHTASRGTYTQATGNWQVGSLVLGASITLVIRVRATQTPPSVNTVTITKSDQYDPNPNNDTASATVNPRFADLNLTKVVDNPSPNVGQLISFTLTLTNNGPFDATGVVVSDPLPAGLTFVISSPSQGTYDPLTGSWIYGLLEVGATATLVLTARVDSLRRGVNTAVASGSEFDPILSNNTASSSYLPQQADLAITKSVDDAHPLPNEVVTFTITIANQGPNDATNVSIHDLLPSGLEFVAVTPSQGTYDSATGNWVVGTIFNGASQTLIVQARMGTNTPVLNTATVVSADQFDPNLVNNIANVPLFPTVADLAVTKVANVSQVQVGKLVTFTITARNLGPDAAQQVVLTDLLPSGLKFVKAEASQGTYRAGNGVWDVVGLVSGGSATLRITVRVTAAKTYRNTAQISFSGIDSNMSNNSSTAVVVGRPSLVLSKRNLLASTLL